MLARTTLPRNRPTCCCCMRLYKTALIVKSNQTDPWPFDQPRNCATFTMRQVLDGSEPILFVSHDEHDHGWQFIGVSDASMSDAKPNNLVQADPTILEIADLPPGWQATRQRVGGAWSRRECPATAGDER